MDLRSLRYFVASFEEGSISGAARRCNVAQPSVSHAVQKLEAVLGAQLFQRSVTGLTPTPAGIALAAIGLSTPGQGGAAAVLALAHAAWLAIWVVGITAASTWLPRGRTR